MCKEFQRKKNRCIIKITIIHIHILVHVDVLITDKPLEQTFISFFTLKYRNQIATVLF